MVGAVIYYTIRNDPYANRSLWMLSCFGPAIAWALLIGMLDLIGNVNEISQSCAKKWRSSCIV